MSDREKWRLWVRRTKCPACRKVRHDQCAGRSAPCRCQQCHYRAIIAEAQAALAVPVTYAPARLVADLLALLAQRQVRRDAIAHSAPARQGRCALPGCRQWVVSSRFGRRRLYCCRYHKLRAWQLKKRREASEAGQAAAAAAAELTVPAEWRGTAEPREIAGVVLGTTRPREAPAPGAYDDAVAWLAGPSSLSSVNKPRPGSRR